MGQRRLKTWATPSADGQGRRRARPGNIRGVTHRWPRALVLTLLGLTVAMPVRAGADGTPLVADAWARFRSVRSEREELVFLIVSAPQAARFSRADADAVLHGGANVTHKRAVRTVRFADDGHDKIHVLFSAPPDDAGTGFLIWRQPGLAQDDQWVFVPGLPNARRISASSTQSFMGTDLIYEDVRELAGERTERFAYELAGQEPVDGRTCTLVVATPRPGVSSAYSSRKIWFDGESHLPLQIEFYDEPGHLRKIMRTGAPHAITPTAYRADFTEVRDLTLDEVTLILTTQRTVGVDLPAAMFTQDYLLHPTGE